MNWMPSRRRRVGTAGILLALGGLSAADHMGVFGGRRSGDREQYDGVVSTVVYVVAGDTVDVDIADSSGGVVHEGRRCTRVRLRGVDVPEGGEAAAWLRREAVGQRVRLALDPHRGSRDTDGTLPAYVYFEDGGGAVEEGVSLNERLIAEGLARAGRGEHVLRQRFVEREEKARKAGKWMWAEGK